MICVVTDRERCLRGKVKLQRYRVAVTSAAAAQAAGVSEPVRGGRISTQEARLRRVTTSVCLKERFRCRSLPHRRRRPAHQKNIRSSTAASGTQVFLLDSYAWWRRAAIRFMVYC